MVSDIDTGPLYYGRVGERMNDSDRDTFIVLITYGLKLLGLP